MPTTTNYGWTTPADTDLVKDGASAIRTLGSAIDSTVFTNAGNAINKTLIDAAGDLIVGSAADTVKRLGIGTSGQVLTVNSGATDLEWSSVSSTYSGASVYGSANQSIANSTNTTVTWNTEAFDTNSYHSTSTNTERFTIPSAKTGYYQLTFFARWAGNATGRRISYIYKNNAIAVSSEAVPLAGGGVGVLCQKVIYCSANDYLDCRVFQTSGGSLDLEKSNDTEASYFQITFLGA